MILQKGLREHLLCGRCEGHLARFERYFDRYWYKRNPLPDVVETPTVTLTGIDYACFKLFMLSIVWRASASTLPQLTNATLGPHEERIRKMILAADPGPFDKYPVVGVVLVDRTTRCPCDSVIDGPRKERLASRWVWRMVFGGAPWAIFTSNLKPFTTGIDSRFLTETGCLTMEVGLFDEFAVRSGVSRVIRESLLLKPR